MWFQLEVSNTILLELISEYCTDSAFLFFLYEPHLPLINLNFLVFAAALAQVSILSIPSIQEAAVRHFFPSLRALLSPV